eukprot:jgi/Undpi1/1126/HiC_scaffold_10.g04588.m1
MENWGFAVEALAYEELTCPQAQYDAFCKISAEFLRPSSPQEINISGKLQADMLSFRKRAARSAVLEEPLREVVMLLEQNVLAEFKQHLTLVMQVRALEAEKISDVPSYTLLHTTPKELALGPKHE